MLRYRQQANVTSQQYADDLIEKSIKVANVSDESTINDVFI